MSLIDRRGRPRAGGVKWLGPGHTPSKWQRWDLNPGLNEEGHPWVLVAVSRVGTCLRVALGDSVCTAASDMGQGGSAGQTRLWQQVKQGAESPCVCTSSVHLG